jgi:poly-beta-hydroxybutyrate-responsive repressor
MEGFIVPCLLLLIKEEPSHGYQLIEKLSKLPFLEAVPDPGPVYRYLRCLEEDGVVKSHLESGAGGPPRKVYSLTQEGENHLEGWAAVIRAKKGSLEGLLASIEKHYPIKTSHE